MYNFKNYLNKFQGKTAWMFGKGPSLEIVKHLNIPENDIKIGINESCRVVDCDYIFAHDEITLEHIWDAKGIFVMEYRFKPLIIPEVANRVMFYNKYQNDIDGSFDELIVWPKQTMCDNEMLVGYQGTAHSAIHFCHYTGISKIILLGFDHEQGRVYHPDLLKYTIMAEVSVYDLIFKNMLKMGTIFNIEIQRIKLLKNEAPPMY